MILDLIAIGIFVLIVVIGVTRGAAKMIIGLVMSFLSFLAASWLSKWIAGLLYNGLFAPKVTQATEQTADDLMNSLPWWAQRAINLSPEKLPSGGAVGETASRAVNGIVQPIVVGVLAILLTLVLFLIINFIAHHFLMKPILRVFRLPFVNAVNKVVGGVIGAIEGLLVICMLAYILKLVLPYIDTSNSFLNESTIYNSFIFYHFYSGNIFSMLTSWIS